MRAQTEALARALNVIGLMNVQFAIKDDQVYILEVNPRASRTVPFVSKSCGVQVAKIGARVMAGESLEELGFTEEVIPEKFCVKEAVLPFAKFPGSDTSLGPEMHSTGEVMGIGSNFAEAFMKAQLGANNLIPSIGKAFISMRDEDKEDAVEIARNLQHLGYGLCATRGTQAYLAKHGIVAQYMNRRAEGRPNIIDAMTNGEIALVINTGNSTGSGVSDGQLIRQKALHMGIPFYTTAAGALAVSIALANQYSLTPYKLQEL